MFEDASGLRCPYCRDPVPEAPVRCPACRVALHPECLRELTSCPTLACPTLPRAFLRADGQPVGATPSAEPGLSPGSLAARRALILPLLFALGIFLAFGVAKGRLRPVELLFGLAGSLPLALATFPSALGEFWAARREPRRAAHLAWAAAAGLSAFLGLLGGFVATFLFEARMLDAGTWELVAQRWPGIWRNEHSWRDMLVVCSLDFALVCYLRLRGWRFRHQLLLSIAAVGAVALVLGWASYDPRAAWPSEERFRLTVFAVISATGAVALPLTSWLVEAIRWPAWLPWLAARPPRRAAAKKGS